MLHQTVGIYASGDFKRNAVKPEHLQDHIDYNLKMRPGRAFFVDGVCMNRGYLTEAEAALWSEKIKTWPAIERCNVPYV